jgi:hypothetical protein
MANAIGEKCNVLCSFCGERGDECEAATPWRGPTSLSVLGRLIRQIGRISLIRAIRLIRPIGLI